MSEISIKQVQLPAHFSQVQLSGLKEIIDHHHEDGHHVQFDVSEIDKIDGAAVQFLLAVSKFQKADGKPETVIGAENEVLISALADMGVNALLPLNKKPGETAAAE